MARLEGAVHMKVSLGYDFGMLSVGQYDEI